MVLAAVGAGAQSSKGGKDQGWTAWAGGPTGDQYSTLTEINRSNVKNLKMAWQYDTGDPGMMQTTPLVVGRMLYAATYTEKVFALDAATGKEIWKFAPIRPGTQPVRGLMYWEDNGKGRLLFGAMNYLYELDATTGQPVAEFGDGGHIDLRENLDTDPKRASAVMTTPGVIYKDMVIVGFRAPETHPAPHGDIRAFDLRTGKMRWTFHTIPHPGEYGYDTWPDGAWKTAGAANNWAGMALDVKRGIVYAPTGSAVNDFYGADRAGDDLFANTLLALDANTGKRIWHFQGVHHDMWDRDFPAHPALVTVKHDGKMVDAVAQTTKQGLLYLFDRVTGKPLFPIEEMKVAKSDVPGEVSSPTQPRPLVPEPYARQVVTEDTLTNRTPEMHQWALEQFKQMKVGTTQFTPFAVDKQTILMSGYDGGAEWGGPAVDPKTAVLYVNANDLAWTGALTSTTQTHGAGLSVYLSQCAVCHGEGRKGSPPEFPSLVGVTDRLTDQQIADTIHSGKGRMPAFPNVQGDLLAALTRYLKTGLDEGAPMTIPLPEHAPLVPGTPAAVRQNPEAAALFAQNCAMCHGEHAQGTPPSIPSLVGVGQRLSATQVEAVIHGGRKAMPAFAKFSSSDLQALSRYLGAHDMPAVSPTEKQELAGAGAAEEQYRFTGYRKWIDPQGYPAVAPPWGTLSAIDLNTGKYLWKIPFGEYPALAAQGLHNTGTENYGGPVVTAGGLLFIGATLFDRQFHAYDSKTGELLWHMELPAGGTATPATYMIDGKQYVVIAAGGGKDPHHGPGQTYVAFSLP
jgi:glucose dehydrogenase